jgi:Tol biopolymer transport system component
VDSSTVPLARVGDHVGRYEILAELGRGGMGCVFRARDPNLDREVALKRPWPELVANPEARARFLREARAASRITHPNVVQVLETLEIENVPWIALQYVPGKDLEALLQERGRLPIEQVLRFATDLAEALQAAHEHRVLHRDIKPRNILIASDGRALLGDFGLARVLRGAGATDTGTTEALTLTPAGTLLGTPRYMSPEQVLGHALDARSDIFSLGAVFYEMCTGTPAFAANERGTIYDAIIHGQPQPIARFSYDVPDELERIIRKMMAKQPEERYPGAGDLLVDVRALRRRLEFDEYSASHVGEKPGPRTHRAFGPRWALGAIAVIAGALVAGWFLTRSHEMPLPEGQPLQLTSTEAWEGQPALSPDGTRIAYAANTAGNQDIYVTDVHGGSPLRLTDDPAEDASPAWFPDGRELAFSSERSGESAIWRTGQFGGGATLLVPNGGDPALSPDGTRIAFTRPVGKGPRCIAVAPLSDPAQAQMITEAGDDMWDQTHPTWSPDGRSICYSTRHGLWVVPASGGSSRRLTMEANLDREPVWAPAGDHVYFSSHRAGTLALWRVRASGGAPERVTPGTGREGQPSLSRDGTLLAYATQQSLRHLTLVDGRTGEETILRGLPDAYQPSFAPGAGWIVFIAPRASGELALWRLNLDGTHPAGSPRQLTDEPGEANNPVVSPDGQWIAYYRVLGEQRDIWVVPARGGPTQRFTDDAAWDIHPAWAPDGTRLAFTSNREKGSQIWVAPVRDGAPASAATRITDVTVMAIAPVWSPRGDTIAFVGWGQDGSEAWIVAADGQTPARRLTTNAGATRVRWDCAGGDLLVCGTWAGDRYALRRVSPVDGVVTAFEPALDLGPRDAMPMFDVCGEGPRVVHDSEEPRGDIWLQEAKTGRY